MKQNLSLYIIFVFFLPFLNTAAQSIENETGKKKEEAIVSSKIYKVEKVVFEMVFVDGGAFNMGESLEDENSPKDNAPLHKVILDDFWIGKFEVTQELWNVVMGVNPSHFVGADLPVESVSWYDCQKFLKRLNRLTGEKFRFPTESEWEYAARGGKKSKGYRYAGADTLESVACYRKNSYNKGMNTPDYGTHIIALEYPNELEIYDMSGNVYEWCSDWYAPYGILPQLNPQGPDSGSKRVCRGGSWYSEDDECLITSRLSLSPIHRYFFLGLRLAK